MSERAAWLGESVSKRAQVGEAGLGKALGENFDGFVAACLGDDAARESLVVSAL